MEYGQYFGQKLWFKHLDVFVSYKDAAFPSQDVNWWTGVMWIIVMFLSAVWTLILTAPIWDPLVSKWCNAKFLQICSDEKTNSLTSYMAWGWVHFKQIFILGWTAPLTNIRFHNPGKSWCIHYFPENILWKVIPYKLNELQVQFCVIFNHIQIERKRMMQILTRNALRYRTKHEKKHGCQYFTGRWQIHVFMGSMSWCLSLRDITFKFLVVIFTIKCTNHIAGKKYYFLLN